MRYLDSGDMYHDVVDPLVDMFTLREKVEVHTRDWIIA